jgi:glycogen debranching enzyme
MNEGCIGNVSEIFDGDAPHRGRGCVAQAWGGDIASDKIIFLIS